MDPDSAPARPGASIEEGDRRLLLAIMETAVVDAQNVDDHRKRAEGQWWIIDDARDTWGSLVFICEHVLGEDPQAVRDALRRQLVAKELLLPREERRNGRPPGGRLRDEAPPASIAAEPPRPPVTLARVPMTSNEDVAGVLADRETPPDLVRPLTRPCAGVQDAGSRRSHCKARIAGTQRVCGACAAEVTRLLARGDVAPTAIAPPPKKETPKETVMAMEPVMVRSEPVPSDLRDDLNPAIAKLTERKRGLEERREALTTELRDIDGRLAKVKDAIGTLCELAQDSA